MCDFYLIMLSLNMYAIPYTFCYCDYPFAINTRRFNTHLQHIVLAGKFQQEAQEPHAQR